MNFTISGTEPGGSDRKTGQPENYLAAAEMGTEQNYNQIDGILNNEPAKPSLLDELNQCRESAGQQPSGASHETLHEWER